MNNFASDAAPIAASNDDATGKDESSAFVCIVCNSSRGGEPLEEADADAFFCHFFDLTRGAESVTAADAEVSGASAAVACNASASVDWLGVNGTKAKNAQTSAGGRRRYIY
jgi:hypothetical protein